MSTYTRLPGLSHNNEYGFRRVVIVPAIVAAPAVVRELRAVAVGQPFIDEEAVGARVVAGLVDMSRSQVFRRPQRAVRDARVQHSEIGIAQRLGRYPHFSVRHDGRASARAELRAVARVCVGQAKRARERGDQ
jgi:hypothetical protein